MWLLAGPTKCNWPSVTLWSVFQYPVTYYIEVPATPKIGLHKIVQSLKLDCKVVYIDDGTYNLQFNQWNQLPEEIIRYNTLIINYCFNLKLIINFE